MKQEPEYQVNQHKKSGIYKVQNSLSRNQRNRHWYEQEKKQLQEELTVLLSDQIGLQEEEIHTIIDEKIIQRSNERYVSVSDMQRLKRELYHSFRGLDVISDLLEDEEISEIMVNGPNCIFIEKHGALYKTDLKFESEDKLRSVVQQIVSSCNRIVNEASPIVDAKIDSYGYRINVVLPPIALCGTVMTIRKFPKDFFTMQKMIDMNSISKEAAEFLEMLVRARYNIFISGGTGSGKTTFLNVLSNAIPRQERIITIEDSAELQISGIDNLVRMETRNANVEGEHAISISDLIKAALRMRPTRIIVGEVRDSAAMDMVNSMLTGHDGSLSTGHGNSAAEMLLRLETMILMGYDMPILAIRQQLAAAIDVIVHLGRLRDNSRHVLEIVEVLQVKEGEIQLNPIYQFQETGERQKTVQGKLVKKGTLVQRLKLEQSGYDVDKINH